MPACMIPLHAGRRRLLRAGCDMQDAADAIDNMHNAELYGRVLRCNYAQPMKIKVQAAELTATCTNWQPVLPQQRCYAAWKQPQTPSI